MTVNVNVTAQKSKRILEYRPAHFEKQIHPPGAETNIFSRLALLKSFSWNALTNCFYKISPYWVQIRENADHSNSEYGHF